MILLPDAGFSDHVSGFIALNCALEKLELITGIFDEATDGIAVITNYWREEQGGAKDWRYAGMLRSAGNKKLGIAELEGILAESALDHGMNVQAVVLEPDTRKVHIARGKPPIARGTWQSLDLSRWLAK